MSRSLIIGLAATIAIIVGLVVFFYSSFVKVSHRSALEAVPDNAAVVLEMSNLPQTWAMVYNTEIWKDLKQTEGVSKLSSLLIRVDSVLKLNGDVLSFLTDYHSTVSFHSNRGEHLSLLWVAETGSYKDVAGFAKWVAAQVGGEMNKRIFDRETVYEIVDGQKNAVLSIAFKDQLLMLSSDGSLVEEAIQKLKYKQLAAHVFEHASKLDLDGAEIGVYVQYQQLPNLLALANKPEYKDLQNPLRIFANWSILKVSLDKEHMDINGVTFTDDSLFQFLDLFKSQAPLENDLSRWMPLGTAISLQMNISNYNQFAGDLTEYLQNSGKLDEYSNYVDSIENRYGISITEKLLPQIGPTAIIGLHESAGSDANSQVFALLQFKNAGVTEALFKSYQQAVERKGEADSFNNSYKQYTINRIQVGNFFKRFLGHSFKQLNSPYYVVKDNLFLMANDLQTLIFMLDELDAQKNLGASESYQKHRKYTVTSSNLNLFVSPGKNISYATEFANEETFSLLSKYAYTIKKFEFVEFQYANSSNSTFFTNVNMTFNPDFKEETKLLWTTQLDTLVSGQPSIVYNASLKQNCILVQDVNHSLYCINQSGGVEWKTKLSGQVLSSIYTVDPHKTGSVAYLMSTDKHTYLLDDKGVSLSGFPIRFPGTATAGITLLDAYGDSTYQLYVPLESKRIMGYDLNGKPLQGWNPKRLNVGIQTQLSFFRLSTGMYLMGTASDSTIWLSGLTAKQPLPEVISGVSPVYKVQAFQSDTQSVEIWYTDTNGYFVNQQMDYQLEWEQRLSVQTSKGDLFHSVIATSGGYALLAAHHSGLTVFDHKARKLVSKVYADTTATVPFFVYNKEHSPMIGYTEPQKAVIHLVDLLGNEISMPSVSGSTPFITGDVMLNNTNFLVCGDRTNSLLLYRLK